MPPLRFVALALTVAALPVACKRPANHALGDTASPGDTMVPKAAMSPIPKNGSDTIAMPAAAVDTRTARPPGEPGGAAVNGKAEGVDTPITRRMGSPAQKKP